jgi:hypothetical protein
MREPAATVSNCLIGRHPSAVTCDTRPAFAGSGCADPETDHEAPCRRASPRSGRTALDDQQIVECRGAGPGSGALGREPARSDVGHQLGWRGCQPLPRRGRLPHGHTVPPHCAPSCEASCPRGRRRRRSRSRTRAPGQAAASQRSVCLDVACTRALAQPKHAATTIANPSPVTRRRIVSRSIRSPISGATTPRSRHEAPRGRTRAVCARHVARSSHDSRPTSIAAHAAGGYFPEAMRSDSARCHA